MPKGIYVQRRGNNVYYRLPIRREDLGFFIKDIEDADTKTHLTGLGPIVVSRLIPKEFTPPALGVWFLRNEVLFARKGEEEGIIHSDIVLIASTWEDVSIKKVGNIIKIEGAAVLDTGEEGKTSMEINGEKVRLHYEKREGSFTVQMDVEDRIEEIDLENGRMRTEHFDVFFGDYLANRLRSEGV